MSARRRAARLAAPSALAAAYLLTLAPSVTLWDAGEFQAAVRTLGIPHPPGTPLYVLVGRVWTDALSPVTGFTVAANLLSAAATVSACGMLAVLLARWLRSEAAGIGAGVAAGTMSSVWLNANETEVYALALLLGAALLFCADNARRDPSGRWERLLIYGVGLTVPLHLSALVAAPAACTLALAGEESPRRRAWRALRLGGVVAGAAAAGLVSAPLAFVSAAGALAGELGLRSGRRARTAAPQGSVAQAARALAAAAGALALVALGMSAVAFLLVRARHDPAVNQGNPVTLPALLDVIARRQYDVPGLWPRRAPLWLQIGNLVQYADWQVALGLDRDVGPSWRRTPWTVAMALLAARGATAHWRAHRPSWTAMAVLAASATLGAVAVLNLRAGPSFGAGVLPPTALHEARERDYFFALGFATLGAWSGVGAVALARTLGPPWRGLGVAVAALPLVLNWHAVNRRADPAWRVPALLADALLASVPPGSVLFVAGDNDTYPLWHAQQVRGVRRDVTVVTLPLLGAEWYREELARRHGLVPDPRTWLGDDSTAVVIAERAVQRGRPVAVAVSVPPATRSAIAPAWDLRGTTYVRREAADSARRSELVLDFAASERARARLAASGWPVDGVTRIDENEARFVAWYLSCPAAVRAQRERPGPAARALLVSRCNFR